MVQNDILSVLSWQYSQHKNGFAVNAKMEINTIQKQKYLWQYSQYKIGNTVNAA